MKSKPIVYFHSLILIAFIFSSCSHRVSQPLSYQSASNAWGQSVVKTAQTYLGTKYKYGGMDRNGIDCSGLVCATYKEHGVMLPRNSGEQYKLGKAVYIGELQSGDLIFFGEKKGSKKVSHTGIVSFSDGKTVRFIHSSTSKGVREDDLAGYWRPLYIGARRLKL